MRIRHLATAVALLLVHSAHSQTALQWVNSMGANGFNDRAFGLAVDAADNVYLGGDFTLTVDFDPGPGVFELTATIEDPFFAKYDAAGNFLWARHLAGRGYVSDIAVDSNGDVLIAGRFVNSLVLDMNTTLTGVHSYDIFFAKFNPAGDLIWGHAIGGTGDDETHAIAIDSDDNLILAAVIRSMVDLDPGVGDFVVDAGVDTDSIVAKYDSGGNFVWGQLFEQLSSSGAAVGDSINAVVIDPLDNVLVAGLYQGSVVIGGVSLVSGSSDAYIAKFNPAGMLQWVKSSEGTGLRKEHFTLGQDTAGNLYAAGIFFGSMDFDPDPMAETVHVSDNSLDMYLASYDADGNFRWVSLITGPGTELPLDIHVRPDGTSTMAGQYASSTDFDPGPDMDIRTSKAGWDCFFSHFDPAGALLTAQTLDGTPTSGGQASAIEAIAATSGGDLMVAGQYRLGVDFDPGPGTFTSTPVGGHDAFVARYGQPLPPKVFSDGFEDPAPPNPQ